MNPQIEEKKTGPKDVFLHLLAIITLYVSAGSFLVLIFQYINVLIPDVLEGGYYARLSALFGIRWSIASLIVVFPTYILVTRFLNKNYEAEPERRNLRSRRWLIYFTLFAAALIIIGDLVTLVFRLLGGEYTTRFLLKVLAVFFVAASVFGYYYYFEIKRVFLARIKIFTATVVVIVAVAVVAGFFVIGSPKAERLRQLDLRRVQDLQQIQSQIVYNFWPNKQRLPASLQELADPISGFVVPRDPESGEGYGYEVKGPEIFVLCATFAQGSSGEGVEPGALSKPVPAGGETTFYRYEAPQYWEHGAGQVCFDRPIDKEIYKFRKD